jgi:hypothetical protein
VRVVFVSLVVLAGCAHAPASSGLTREEEAALDRAASLLDDEEAQPLTEEQLRIYPDARGMPTDVQNFIVRWQDCQHWLGEVAWDEARRRQIETAVAEICPGIDLFAWDLRRQYAGDAEVIERLRDYGPLGQ